MSTKTEQPKLQSGIRYCLTVVTAFCGRSFLRDNRPMFNHKITFADSYGVQYLAEYVIPEQHQDYFVVGTRVCFKVVAHNQYNPEIVPLPGIDQQADKLLILEGPRPVTGETYSQALAHAVTLMSAIIGKSKATLSLEELLQEDDEKAPPGLAGQITQKVCSMADDLDEYLFLKLTIRTIGE